MPPRGYLSAVRDACRASGALLIVDELVTGVGVTGRLFAVDEEEVAPDILVLGGVLGGAMLPMALYVASRRVNDAVYRRSDPVLHGTTTGGNPAACVAALATLERVREERLVDGAAESGRTIAAALEELRAEFPELAVAGRGLLAAVRAPSARQALAIRSAGLEAGVLLRIDGGAAGEAWIGIRPPLGIRSDELALGLRATQTAFRRGLGAAGVAA